MEEHRPTAAAPTAETAAIPPCVEVLTGENPTHSIIWLHGLGADGHDFEPIVPELNIEGSVRFVFPHAPVRPVTLNGGMPMRAWYDIKAISASRDQDEEGILQSAASVAALVHRENQRGIPSERIILAGFSQGGAVALHAALRYPETLGGLVVLSSYLLFAQRLAGERSAANQALPVFLAHGTQDPVVPFFMGEATRDALQALGQPLTWRQYPMQHAVCLEQIVQLGQWLNRRIATTAPTAEHGD